MRQEPIETTIERLHRLGYDGIEISGEPTQHDTSHVGKLLEKYGLACWGSHSIMMPGRDLVHEDPAVRTETVQYMQACVQMVHELQGAIFVIFPTECGRLSREAGPTEEWRWAVEGIKRIVDYAAERDIRVGIEALNRFETHFINRHDQALALADEVGPEVGVALDAFHMNIEEVDPLQAIRNVGNRLIDFHVADNNRRPPGEGSCDWKAVIRTLREVGYDAYLTQEFVNPIDRTPLGVRKEGGSGEVSADLLKFLQDHGSGVLSAEEYDQAVRQAITYLKKLV
jgi:sugar phosphate isomerase/epimerase